MKKTMIITGGTLDLEFASNFLKTQSYQYLIAVDGGLEKVAALGLTPTAIVGDFDTVDPQLLAQYQSNSKIIWDKHQPDKDETDTELAFAMAWHLQSSHITILGALGGRMDHGLANIQLLYLCLEKKIEAVMIDPQNKIYLLDKECTFRRADCWGKYLSFLPFSDQVIGLTLHGFKYPLVNQSLKKGLDSGLCISNELIQDEGRLILTEGILICVESHD